MIFLRFLWVLPGTFKISFRMQTRDNKREKTSKIRFHLGTLYGFI